jgi:hypothetical protein
LESRAFGISFNEKNNAFKISALKFSNKASLVYKVKGKAIPLQAWTGSEVSRRLRLPDFKTNDT